MKNTFSIRGINFEIGNYKPRNNEYEKGLKYILFRTYTDRFEGLVRIDTGYRFSTKHEAKSFANKNLYEWM